MNRQSKDDFAYILICTCIGGLVVMNLTCDTIPERFVALVAVGVWIVFLSRCQWEDS